MHLFDVGAPGLPEALALRKRVHERPEHVHEIVLRRAHDRHLHAEVLLGLAHGVLVQRRDDRLAERHPLDGQDPVPVAEHLVDDDVGLLDALERLLVPHAVHDVEIDRKLLARVDHVLRALLVEVRGRMDDADAFALDGRDRVVARQVDPRRQDLRVVGDEAKRGEGADDARVRFQPVHELLLRALADVGAQEVEERLAPSRPEDRELQLLRDEREPEIEVEDVRLRQQLGERSPLDGLLAEQARPRPVQVPVGLVRAERLRVEDDETRVDPAPAKRLHVRPADPGQVDRAVRDAERHDGSIRF